MAEAAWPEVALSAPTSSITSLALWTTGVTAEVGVLGITWSLLWNEMARAQFNRREVLIQAKTGRGAMISFFLARQQDRLVDALMNHGVPVEEVRSVRFKNY